MAEPASETTAPRTEKPWLQALLVAGAFAAFAGLMTCRLGEREFWIDEEITVGHIASAETVSDVFHPPGYYFLLRQWAAVFGESDVALRAFSVPWALIALLMVWLIARNALPRTSALLALWLCALSPFLLLYLRMARYFALVMAVALAAVWFLLECRRHGRPWAYAGLALASAGLLWLHHVPSLLLPLGYVWLLPTAWRRGKERWAWLAAAALPVVAYSGHLARALHGVGQVAGGSADHAVGLRGVLLRLTFPWYSVLIGETTEFWRFYVVVPVVVVGLVLWIVGTVKLWREKGEARWPLLLLWPLTVALVMLLMSTVAASEPWPRVSSLCLFAAPFFYLLVARGVGAFGRQWATTLAVVFLLGELYGTANYLAGQQFLNPGYNVPWRRVNALVQSYGAPGDIAIAVLDSTMARYWDGPVRFYDPLAHQASLSPADEAATDTVLRQGHSVWLICRDRGSDVAKGPSDELIDRLTERAAHHEVYRVFPRSAQERRWRSLIQGGEVGDAYLTVHRFDSLRAPTPAHP